MAYLTHVFQRRQDLVNKISSVRKHNHITPIRRRILQIFCGFLVGLIVAWILSKKHRVSYNMCRKVLTDWRKENAYDNIAEAENRSSLSTGAANSNKSLLFVGVMTAQKYLDTRAAAVFETWGKEIPGKVAFFSSAISVRPPNAPDLPLIPIKGVDDSYPPQKKSFLMLQYMWEHFGDKYEWFLRADDDVYIRTDKIEAFLRSVNSSKPQFIGQAGRGNQEEFGLLSLEYDENFCMGGPGIILSRETLRRMAPHVKYCLQNLYTTHEDVELGRCVQRFAHISCTWSYEMQSIFYHNFSGGLAFTGNLKTKEVHRAITLHPIKQHKHMYRLHHYMESLKIRELQQRKVSLHRDLYLMEEFLRNCPNCSRIKSMLAREKDENIMRDAILFGKQPTLSKYRPRTEDDVFTWDLISRSLYSDDNSNPRRRIDAHLKEGLDDVVREVMDNINLFSRERGRVIEFQQILYGYYQPNPLYGPNYILDVLLTFKKYRGKKMTVPVRRHAYLQQQFVGLEIREIPVDFEADPAKMYTKYLDSISNLPNFEKLSSPIVSDDFEEAFIDRKISRKLINFILPLFGKFEAFLRFMKTYEEVCLRRQENTALIVVLFLTADANNYDEILKITNALAVRYRRLDKIKIIRVREAFARAKALHYGMAEVNSDDLLFFVDVDMVWSAGTLQRIRLNTVAGKMVYFPIVFSEFDPWITYKRKISPNHFLINDESGYWRIFGYGIMSAYKADIIKVGGFNISIVGWGKEDVDLFEKFLPLAANTTILRSVDPSLVHIFHIVDCDSSLDVARFTMCRNTRSETYGSVNQLASLMYKYNSSILQFAFLRNQVQNMPIR